MVDRGFFYCPYIPDIMFENELRQLRRNEWVLTFQNPSFFEEAVKILTATFGPGGKHLDWKAKPGRPWYDRVEPGTGRVLSPGKNRIFIKNQQIVLFATLKFL